MLLKKNEIIVSNKKKGGGGAVKGHDRKFMEDGKLLNMDLWVRRNILLNSST